MSGSLLCHNHQVSHICLPFVVHIQVWDTYGVEVSSRICKIIGADGGFADKPKTWPADGLLTDVAYRWDAVSPYT